MIEHVSDYVKVWGAWIVSSLYAIMAELMIPMDSHVEIVAIIKSGSQALAFVVALAYTLFKFYRDWREYKYLNQQRQENGSQDETE